MPCREQFHRMVGFHEAIGKFPIIPQLQRQGIWLNFLGYEIVPNLYPLQISLAFWQYPQYPYSLLGNIGFGSQWGAYAHISRKLWQTPPMVKILLQSESEIVIQGKAQAVPQFFPFAPESLESSIKHGKKIVL
jgi:hypothetical protein